MIQVKLTQKEIEFVHSLIEAQTSRLLYLAENQQKEEPYKGELDIARRLGKKLAIA